MRNLKLVSVVFGLLFGVAALSHAGGLTKPRSTALHSYSTTPTLVASGPGAVYQVVMATGTASEYVILVDSASVTGVVATSNSKAITPRLFYGSTTASTVITFDPPIVFRNGLVVAPLANTGQLSVSYETGRSIGGN